MRRARFASGFALLALVAGLASGDPGRMAVLGAPILSAPAPFKPLDDPFPIRRVPISAEQLDEAVRKLNAGPMTRLPLAEVEARVQRAARVAAATRDPPRLVESKQTAVLDGADLRGEADWTFANRPRIASAFTWDAPSIAVSNAAWADGAPAALGAAELRVPPGQQVLKLKWSAAGSGTDAVRRFDLKFPPCPAAALELDLPPDRTPSTGTDALVTGPFASPRDPKLKRWHIRFSETGRLDLTIRGPSETGGPVVAVSTTAKYDLADAQLAALFEFELRTARGSASEWLFAVPPGLIVLDALANDRAGWRFDAPTRTLRVQTRQASSGGKFVVTTVGPLPAALAALSAVRPVNAVGSVERFEVRVPVGVSLSRLETGDYRIQEHTVAADGTRTTVLTGSFAKEPVRRPPAIQVVAAGPEFTTDETLDWRIDAGRVRLAARVEVTVKRGPLFGFGFRPPPGFALDRVVTEPDDLVAQSGPVQVEFTKPLTTAQRVTVTFEFQGPPVNGEVRLPLAAFAPLGASGRDGRVRFAPDPGWTFAVQPGPGVTAAPNYDYRGVEPNGTVIIAPVGAAFTADVEHKPQSTRIRLTPTRGQLGTIRFLEPGPPVKRSWSLHGSSNAIASSSSVPVPFFGTIRTVSLGRPTSEAVTLETGATSSTFAVLGASETRHHSEVAIESPAPSSAWSFEGLRLTTIASRDRPRAVLTGTITGRDGHTLRIALPSRAEVVAASVGLNWLEPGRCRVDAAGGFNLPLPAGAAPLAFQIEYRFQDAASPLPALPGEPTIERWWAVPRGLAAVWPFDLRSQPRDAPVAGSDFTLYRSDASRIVLMPAVELESAGFVVAALLAIVAWFGTRNARRTTGVLLLALLAAAGVATWLGPDSWKQALVPPLIATVIGAAAIAVARGVKRVPLAAVLALVPAVALTAQTPADRDVVFIVGKETAVVPAALLERLDVLASAGEPAPMIASASYSGRMDDGLAWFTAKYSVHAFRDGETMLELPLGEVRLERATVNGQPAQPQAAKANSYTIPLPGRGVHVVELRFAVNAGASGPEREVRFAIPPAPDSQVDFTALTTARQLQAVGRTGAGNSIREKDAVRLTASLGAVPTLHLRWREGPAGAAAAVSAREGCLWDVSDSTQKLTACYQLEVKSGSVPAFRFDLPASLEPTRVAVRSLDSLLVPTVVRDWAIGKEANGWRPLTIDLLAAADGRVLVTLECVPRTAPTTAPVLGFPRIAGMTRESAVYGLRLNGVAADSIGRSGVIDFAADALIRDFGSVPDLRLTPGAVVTAFSPRVNEVPELRPVLKPAAAVPAVTLDTTWNIDPARAIGRGTVAWSGEAGPRIEFLTSAAISEVRSADVAAWSQVEGRVQVWLRRPVKDGSLEWFATAAVNGPFDPPLPQPQNARVTGNILRLRLANGFGARIESETGWKTISPAGRERVWQVDALLPPPRVHLVPPGSGAARGFGLLEFNGSASLRASVELPIPPGAPQHLVLQLGAVPAGPPAIDVPPGTVVRERKEPDGSLTWSLDVPAGPGAKFRATLTVPLPTKGRVPMPAIDLRPGNQPTTPDGVVRSFGVVHAPTDVQFEGMIEADEGQAAALRTAWPGEAERLRRAGGAWWIASGGSPAVVFPAPAAPAPPVAKESVPLQPAATSYAAPRSQWVAAAAWTGAAVLVLMMFVRAPRSTWPEQVGLLGGLLGQLVAGQPAWGIAAYVAARMTWLLRAMIKS